MNDSINKSATNNEKDNDTKGITLVSLGILTIVFAIAGATFAFFQVTASADIPTGESAYSANPLTIDITDATEDSVGTKKLIPQLDKDIQTAVTGTANGSCVDSSGSAVCKVYEIKVTNVTDANFYLSGELSFTTTPSTTATTGMPNLKWAKGTSATTGFPTTNDGPFYSTFNTFVANTTSTQQSTNLTNTFMLAAGGSSTFYVVVWISETGAVQSDRGSFTGNVSFTGYSSADQSLQGVTSTIRSDITAG